MQTNKPEKGALKAQVMKHSTRNVGIKNFFKAKYGVGV